MAGSWTPGQRPDVEGAQRRALEAIGRLVLRDSNKDVPVDEGDLLASGKSRVDGDTVRIGYSDPKAVAAHENQSVAYQGGKSAKFLERSLTSNRAQIAAMAQAELRRAFQ